MKTKVNKNIKGFTLIELLVVIAIIGILAAVVLIALNPVEFLRRSRDTQRLSDMETLVTATKLFQTNNPAADLTDGPICHTAAPTTLEKNPGGTGWTLINYNQGSASNIIPAIPVDPAPATSVYGFISDVNQNFEYSAVLESTTNTAKMAGDGGDQAARYEAGTILSLTMTCP